MKLIDRHDRGAGIIDSRRKRLDSDVDDHPEREGRVLLDRAFRAECNLSSERAIVDLRGIAVEPEQRLAGSHEVTNARDKRDDAISSLGESN